jgi:hypothetical protein
VEAELYQYVMNTRKNRFAVSMEMLQFEGCRIASKHNISVTEFSQLWMGEAFYGQTRPHHKATNDNSTDTTRSIRGKACQFPDICLKTEKAA